MRRDFSVELDASRMNRPPFLSRSIVIWSTEVDKEFAPESPSPRIAAPAPLLQTPASLPFLEPKLQLYIGSSFLEAGAGI